LIGLGFADNREEVKAIMDSVDDDGNGDIEFPEFLSIVMMGSCSDGNGKNMGNSKHNLILTFS